MNLVKPLNWQNPPSLNEGKYNMVVIGAGAGGLVTAIGSSLVGGKVAIVEKMFYGGDCLNTGCVPSKAFIKSSKVIHLI